MCYAHTWCMYWYYTHFNSQHWFWNFRCVSCMFFVNTQCAWRETSIHLHVIMIAPRSSTVAMYLAIYTTPIQSLPLTHTQRIPLKYTIVHTRNLKRWYCRTEQNFCIRYCCLVSSSKRLSAYESRDERDEIIFPQCW